MTQPAAPAVPVRRYGVVPPGIQKLMLKDALCSNLYVTEIGYEGDTTFHPFTKNKARNHYLLVYVAKGSGWYRVKGKVYAVEENDYFVLPTQLARDLGASEKDPWSIYWAYFAGTQAEHVVAHLMGDTHAPGKAKPLVGRVAQFNDILHHLELMENTGNRVYVNSRFYTFLCSFKLVVLSAKTLGKKDNVIQTIEFMRDNVYGNVTLEQLAQIAGLSVSHYCAQFKRKTMQTPIQLYMTLKIQRACQLLQNGNQTIKAIAYQLGFFDQYHFSKVFKQIIGVSPKIFRTKNAVSG
jgi:AraC-like DNA-binding protein